MRKIFTLIAMAMLAMGVNAQTTIEFKGLLPSNFTYDSNAYTESVWTDEESGQSANAFTYTGTGEYAAITLTNKNVKFNYKNSGEKENFFILNRDYFTIGGKGVQMIISGLTKGQKVTLKVAPKENGNAPTFGAGGGALIEGDATTMVTKEEFVSLTYKVTGTSGELTITNGDYGYLIESITIAEGESEATIENPVYVKTVWTLADPANLTGIVEGDEVVTAETVTTGEDFDILPDAYSWSDITFTKFQPKSSDKGANDYAKAKAFGRYIDFKVTPGKLYAVSKVSFDLIKIGTGDPQAFIDVIDGEGLENSIAGPVDIRRNKDDGSDNTSINQTYEVTTSPSANPVTLRIYIGKLANNKQVGLANVMIEGNVAGGGDASVTTLKSNNDQNDVIYNLAGQKVDNGFKGIAVKNGKKVVLK